MKLHETTIINSCEEQSTGAMILDSMLITHLYRQHMFTSSYRNCISTNLLSSTNPPLPRSNSPTSSLSRKTSHYSKLMLSCILVGFSYLILRFPKITHLSDTVPLPFKQHTGVESSYDPSAE